MNLVQHTLYSVPLKNVPCLNKIWSSLSSTNVNSARNIPSCWLFHLVRLGCSAAYSVKLSFLEDAGAPVIRIENKPSTVLQLNPVGDFWVVLSYEVHRLTQKIYLLVENESFFEKASNESRHSCGLLIRCTPPIYHRYSHGSLRSFPTWPRPRFTSPWAMPDCIMFLLVLKLACTVSWARYLKAAMMLCGWRISLIRIDYLVIPEWSSELTRK